MSSLIGVHGLSYFQIVGLFLALAGGHFASTPSNIEGSNPVWAFLRVFVSVRGNAAILLLSLAAIVMVWPTDGRPDDAVVFVVSLLASLVVATFAFVISWRSR